jgi:tRNA/rRNA methyltransferase/tRNA (cytidine32/uridine32-2'-O)-methyltransferase
MRSDLSAALLASRFLQDDGRGAVDELLAPVLRGRLSRKEAELWKAALKTLGKALGNR